MASGKLPTSQDGGQARTKLAVKVLPPFTPADLDGTCPDRLQTPRERARRTVETFQQQHKRMSVFDLLQRVRTLLGIESRWSQFAHARGGKLVGPQAGFRCDPDSPYANRWDIMGALYKEAPEEWHNLLRYDATMLLGELASMPVQFFNDLKSHAQVLELLERGIAAAREVGI